MNLKHISKWMQQEEMEKILFDKKIKSWLLEQGPITNRIKLKHKFELKLLRDSAGKVEISDKSFLDNVDGETHGMQSHEQPCMRDKRKRSTEIEEHKQRE